MTTGNVNTTKGTFVVFDAVVRVTALLGVTCFVFVGMVDFGVVVVDVVVLVV